MKKTTKLSDLCKLSFSDEKTEKEFWDILLFLCCEKLAEPNPCRELCKEAPACLRADVVNQSLDKGSVMALTANHENGFVVIPEVLEET